MTVCPFPSARWPRRREDSTCDTGAMAGARRAWWRRRSSATRGAAHAGSSGRKGGSPGCCTAPPPPAPFPRAATQVPYYREQWSKRRRSGDRASWEVLANWPILEKDEVQKYGPAFVADDCARWRMMCERTSGTTGTPLAIWKSRPMLQELYALSAPQPRRWNGVTDHHPWAVLAGQLVVPVAQRKPPFWVWNAEIGRAHV